MRKLKIYLDTSVINFYFADDAPDFKKVTIDFFENHLQKYQVFISEIVLFEIKKTTDETTRNTLLGIIQKYPIMVLEIQDNEEINKLSNLYIKENIIPLKKREDALHLAIATIYEFDILLSWNFKHLANINKQMLINSINEKEGYLKKLNLLSPLEVFYEE